MGSATTQPLEPLLRLVQPASNLIDPATIAGLQQMLELAHQGVIVGVAYVAIHPAKTFTIGMFGAAERDPQAAYAGCGKLQTFCLELI